MSIWDERDERVRELQEGHLRVRNSAEYTAEGKFLHRLVGDFVETLHLANVLFTRYPESHKWLLQRETDGLIESAAAVLVLAVNGMVNPARRELRHLLEAVLKFMYVDQQLSGGVDLDERVRFLGSKVPDSSVSIVDEVVFRLGQADTVANDTKSTFSQLCRYVHPSQEQTLERIARAKRGEFIGFESAAQMRAFNKELARTLDLVLILYLEGIGPSFTGDVFELALTKKSWKFHKTRHVGPLGERFAYKNRNPEVSVNSSVVDHTRPTLTEDQ
jgi:hypothetical protein